ncbi:MAG: citrate synthase [Polyangiaceae bacterium]|nr:citrate synthase [Polyangiaceae bacterium]
MTENTAKLTLGDQTLDLPVVVGTEDERAVDVSALRARTGYITLDPGFRSTGSCRSAVTFIDGEKGILRYRGYPIEQLAEATSFPEVAWLLIWGELPTESQLLHFRSLLTKHEMIHEGLRKHYEGFPTNAEPMAVLSAMINACSCYHPDTMQLESEGTFESAAARLLSKVRTIAAAAYKKSVGQPVIYPNPNFTYCKNFLHMMFSEPYATYEAPPEVVAALRLFLILHADHEQNCSTSTVRMVASSGANLFASAAAGVCALWGWRHGGANVQVIEMLNVMRKGGISAESYLERVKRKEVKLMGFGHRVYKNYDPRARILQKACGDLLRVMKIDDPLLDLARRVEEIALSDDYFVSRNLYPNVDFYSGIILRAIGIPTNMFTVMFSIGRMPGWIAHFKEVLDHQEEGIARPRQVYTGPAQRDFVPMAERHRLAGPKSETST